MNKVKIRSVTPIIAKHSINTFKKSMLGISVSSPIYQDQEKLSTLFKWLSENYSHTHIIIGDYLHRINEAINYGKTTSDAIEKSLYIGCLIDSQITIELNKYPKEMFTVSHWKDCIYENSNFHSKYNNLTEAYKTCNSFRESIQNIANNFIEKQSSKGEISLNRNEAIDLSINYIIEEMAVFSLFIDMGYTVQLYPGTTLPILKELANGMHSEVDTNLKQGTYIDLKIK